MRSTSVVCVLLAGLGCSGRAEREDGMGEPGGQAPTEEIPTACSEQSGNRLRRVLRDNTDGSQQFRSMFDSELGENCTYRSAADGSLRCIPDADGNPVATGRLVFSDPACTASVAEIPYYQGAALYLREGRSEGGCATTYHLYALGDRLSVTREVTQMFALNGTACQPFTVVSDAHYRVADEVPSEGLVAGDESYSETGRLAVRQIDGNDGSRFCDQMGRLIDRALGDQPCSPAYDEEGEIRCLPSAEQVTTLYTDPGCTTEIAVAIPTSPLCDVGHASASIDGCASRRTLHQLGDPVTVPLYQKVGIECLARGVVPTAQIPRAVGDAVDVESFARLEIDWVAEDTRLERGDLIEASGLRVFRDRLRDTEQGDTPCSFGAAADGTQRCLPSGDLTAPWATVTSVFRDPTCLQPTQLARRTDACDAPAPHFAAAGAGQGTRVYEIGAADSGPIYVQDGATCTPAAIAGSFYSLGPEIEAVELVGGAEVIR